MNTKRNHRLLPMIIALSIFAPNSFAYSNDVLTLKNSSDMKRVKTKLDYSAHAMISRNPQMVNQLRVLFMSNQKANSLDKNQND